MNVMSKAGLYAVIALAGVLCASQARAGILLQDNFDSYADQAAFVAAWPASGSGTTSNGTSGTLDTAQAFSVPNSINYPTTAGERNNHSFTDTLATTGAEIEWSFRFFDSNGTASAYRQYSEIIDGGASGSGQLIAMGLNNNIVSSNYMARVLGSDVGSGVSAFGKLDGAGVPTRSTGWHELKAVIKGPASSSVDFYVDGVFSKNVPVLSTRSYDAVRMGSNLSATSPANFDNELVQTIPEPACLGLLALAAIGLMRRRRRA